MALEKLKASADYQSLNALVSVMDASGNFPLHLEKQAARAFMINVVNQNTVFFHSVKERQDYLIEEGYYEPKVFNQYSESFINKATEHAFGYKFRFKSLLGASKFFSSYALKTRDGTRYLERYEERVVAVALYLAMGDEAAALDYIDEIITGRYQPATPTFANAGKLKYGELVSCFITLGSDNLEDISRQWVNAAQLSKIGGGVGICITDWRATGDPIRGVLGRATGLVGWCKILESVFSKVDQLGTRPGAGIVWVNALHLDAPDLIDAKRENVDEQVRLKTLNIGLVIPDIMYFKAIQNKKVYLFSPYDVARVLGKPMSQVSLTDHYDQLAKDPTVRKTAIDAREYFQQISGIQMESGYPFVMHEDTVNRANPIAGHVSGSNLCVTGDTLLLTPDGEFPIRELVGQTVNVWNGEQWSETVVQKTGENQKIVTVKLASGKQLPCTEYHKWYPLIDKVETETRTEDLLPNSKLKWELPASYKVSEAVKTKLSNYKFEDTVIELVYEEALQDTYCVNEPLRHRAVFNGILTGNCSEILQVSEHSTYNVDGSYNHVGRDISCNLGSINVFQSIDGRAFEHTVNNSVRMCTAVSMMTHIAAVPTVAKGNDYLHAIGVGAMNLHGAMAAYDMDYGDQDSVEFTDAWFMACRFNALTASVELAREQGKVFGGFERSRYADGTALRYYFRNDYRGGMIGEKAMDVFKQHNLYIPSVDDWHALSADIQKYGMFNAYLMAVAPTGSVSYLNNATASIHPIASQIEERHEGRVYGYYPAPHMTNENRHLFKDAFQIGPYKIIDVYAAATKHTDQGASLTLFFQEEDTTTRTIDQARFYAWRKGIKTLYYVRARQESLAEDMVPVVCESCSV